MTKTPKNYKWLTRAHNLGLMNYEITLLIILSFLATITEVFGIGIFLPIFQFMRLEGDINSLIDSSSLWKYIVDIFSYFNVEISLAALLIISFSFFLVRQIFSYFRLVYQSVVAERIKQTQRKTIFNRYIEADTSYHDDYPVGSLANLITTEVDRAINAITIPLEIVVYFIMMLGYISVLMLISWEMTVASIIILFIASMITKVWIKKSRETGRNIVDANTSMSKFLIGRLYSPRLVRIAGTETYEKNQFDSLTKIQRKHLVYASILRAKTQVAMDPIIIGISLLFLYFSYTVFHLQIEVLGLYLVIALRLMPVVKGVITQWQSVQNYLGSMETVEKNLESMKKSIEIDEGTETFDQIKKSIVFKNVSYRYPKQNIDILKNISIEFRVNEIIAVVGHSGSGKSTLIDLLPRLRTPTKGSIFIDGTDIRKYTLNSLRKKISYSPQSPHIFDGTVKTHILYGNSNLSDNSVYRAAYLSGAEDFINRLPHGFDTAMGDGANKLSGGQKQRLDLTRVLVGKNPILILDEPTSNLDAKSEEMFKRALRKIHKETNTTIVIIAHRLKSISDAHNIIVINKGEVEMSGTHEELMNKGGWYADAWKIQQVENNN
jgi:ABC-type multidrug transport system fused ATPase/permease subunit